MVATRRGRRGSRMKKSAGQKRSGKSRSESQKSSASRSRGLQVATTQAKGTRSRRRRRHPDDGAADGSDDAGGGTGRRSGRDNKNAKSVSRSASEHAMAPGLSSVDLRGRLRRLSGEDDALSPAKTVQRRRKGDPPAITIPGKYSVGSTRGLRVGDDKPPTTPPGDETSDSNDENGHDVDDGDRQSLPWRRRTRSCSRWRRRKKSPSDKGDARGSVQRITSEQSSIGTFFSFLAKELTLDAYADGGDGSSAATSASSRVYNFLTLPLALEKLMYFGWLICADCFLIYFTFLPLRMIASCIFGAWQLLRCMATRLFCFGRVCYGRGSSERGKHERSHHDIKGGVQNGRMSISTRQLHDIFYVLLIVCCFTALRKIHMSRLYHYIRGQSVLKLYVIFNMLQIFDRLFCAFGDDVLCALFGSYSGSDEASQNSRKPLWTFFHFAVAAVYTFLHALVLFAEIVTLNVSINSNESSLFVLLISNNFVELKGCVFKRFRTADLFQISCSDIVERFNLSVFMAVIATQHISHIGLSGTVDWLFGAGFSAVIIFVAEVVVDWIKHGFITKFNRISPKVYAQYRDILGGDLTSLHAPNAMLGFKHSITRRLGLPSLPLAVIVLREIQQAFLLGGGSIALKFLLAFVLFCVFLAIKLLVSIVILGHAYSSPASVIVTAATLTGTRSPRSRANSARHQDGDSLPSQLITPEPESRRGAFSGLWKDAFAGPVEGAGPIQTLIHDDGGRRRVTVRDNNLECYSSATTELCPVGAEGGKDLTTMTPADVRMLPESINMAIKRPARGGVSMVADANTLMSVDRYSMTGGSRIPV